MTSSRSETLSYLLWDIEAFYDSLDISLLIDKALQNKFPAAMACLELLGSVAPRYLKESGGFSRDTHPERSLVADAGSGVGFRRSYLYDLLDQVTMQHPPVGLHAWVDDVVQKMEATRARLLAELPAAAASLARGLQQMGVECGHQVRCHHL